MRLLWIIIILFLAGGIVACDPIAKGKKQTDRSIQELYELNKKLVELESRGREGERRVEQDIINKEKLLSDREFEMQERERRTGGFFNRILKMFSRPDTIIRSQEPPDLIDRYDLVYEFLHGDQEEAFALLQNQVDSGRYFMDDSLATGYEVFGWHPYWMNGAYKGYNFKLLSTVAFFAYDLDPKVGTYRNKDAITAWKSSSLVDSAHKYGCRVLLTVSNHGILNNEMFLGNPQAQERLIDSLIFLLRIKDADGIDLDFEMVPPSQRISFAAFVRRLNDRLDRSGRDDYYLSVCLPAGGMTGAFDFEMLDSWVDQYVIMGYDLHHSRGDWAGPISPLETGQRWQGVSLTKSVANYLALGAPRQNLILALPYYGTKWNTTSDSIPSRTVVGREFVEYLTYTQIQDYDPFVYQRKVDPVSQSKYFTIKDELGGKFQQVWYEDSITLGIKMEWIQRQGLAGVGVWALGYDYGRSEMWGLLGYHFGQGSPDLMQLVRAQKRFAFIALVRKYRGPLIAAGFFIVIFLALGFLLSMLDWRVRDALFYSGSARVLYAATAFGVLLGVLAILGVISNKELILAGGLLLGLVIAMSINRVTVHRRRSLP